MSGLELTTAGPVSFNGSFVGEFDGETLILNAAWCRLAGLGIRVDGDTTDRRRVLLERPDKAKEPAGRPVKGGHVEAPDPAQAEIPVEEPPAPVRPQGTVMGSFGDDDREPADA